MWRASRNRARPTATASIPGRDNRGARTVLEGVMTGSPEHGHAGSTQSRLCDVKPRDRRCQEGRVRLLCRPGGSAFGRSPARWAHRERQLIVLKDKVSHGRHRATVLLRRGRLYEAAEPVQPGADAVGESRCGGAHVNPFGVGGGSAVARHRSGCRSRVAVSVQRRGGGQRVASGAQR